MHGLNILCQTSKVTFEIPHKISYQYIERCVVYWEVKIQIYVLTSIWEIPPKFWTHKRYPIQYMQKICTQFVLCCVLLWFVMMVNLSISFQVDSLALIVSVPLK